MLFREPCAKIDEAATLAAERAIRRGVRPLGLALAGGAGNFQLQQLSVNGTSAVAWVGRAPRPFQLRKRTLER